MMLNQEQATTTAFTLPGQGQFQWTQTPLGILGAEASFHGLLTSIFGKLPSLLAHGLHARRSYSSGTMFNLKLG